MNCSNCGRQLPDGVSTCPSCGAVLGGSHISVPKGRRLTWINVLRLLFANWFKTLLRSIPFMVIIFCLSMVIHSFLLVYYNEGFGDSTALGRQILNIQDGAISSTILWMAVSAFIFALIPALFKKGPAGIISEMRSLPGNTAAFIKESPSAGLQIFLTGTGITLIISSLMSETANLFLALGAAAILALPFGRILAALVQSSWTTLLQAVRPAQALNLARYGFLPGYLVIFGTIAGFALGMVLPFTLFFGVLAILAASILLFTGKQPPAAAIRVLLFLSAATFIVLKAKGVLADDGGWIEAGGTWEGWINSQGATEAVTRGIGPSLGSALGPSLVNSATAINPGDFGEDADEEDLVADYPELQGGPEDNPFTDFWGGDGPGMCNDNGLPNYWVNTSTLNLVISDTVFSYSGRGPTVRLTLTYNADPNIKGIFGRGWCFSYESSVEERGGQILVRRGSGQKLGFQPRPGLRGEPSHPAEAISMDKRYDRLLDYGDYWLFIEKSSRLMYRYVKNPGSTYSPLNSIHDLNGNQVILAYNTDGTPAEITDAAGRVTRLAYQGGLCSSMTVPDGRTASYSYDQSGHLIGTVDLLGVTAEYAYDGNGYPVQMIIGRERKTTLFSYSKRRKGMQLAAVKDANGNQTTFMMVSEHPCQVRASDREGNITSYFSANGYTEKTVDPLGNTSGYTYNQGLPISFTSQKGQSARTEYDAQGNLIKYTDRLGATTSGSYDAAGNLLQMTDQMGGNWSYTYDDRSNLVSIRTPAGRTQSMAYNRAGQLISITNPAGITSTFEYNPLGKLTGINYPGGNSIHLAYDKYGLVNTARTDADGRTTHYEYDQNGHLTRLIHPDGTFRAYGWDCCAGIFTSDENGCSVAYERDPLLNILAYHDALGNITSYQYDRDSRQVKSVDAAGHSMAMEYDAAGRLVRSVDPAGQWAAYQYDACGNLVMLQDQCGQKTMFEYDANGRLAKIIDSMNNGVTIERDAAGRLSSLLNARGDRVGYAYDPDGQVTAKSHNGELAVSCQYDTAGNLARINDASGSTTHFYNAARRVEAIEYPGGYKASFTNYPSGKLRSIAYPGGLQVDCAYDVRGRLESMSWNRHRITYAYDAAGNLVKETRTNGTESTYGYDANYQLAAIKHMKEARAFIDMRYRRDALGNIIEESGVKPCGPSGSHGDDAGVKASYNLLNQLVSWNSSQYSYDADGNLITITGSRDFNAVYDPENRLLQMVSGSHYAKNSYNGFNQRIRRESPAAILNFHYSPDGLLLFSTNDEGRVISRFIYSGNRLAAMVDSSGNSYFYHFDHNGSTLIVSGENGDAAAAYDYSAYGKVIESAGSLPENIFTYVGAWGVVDDSDGWYFMKHRFYDATTGRFIQKDPIGIAGGQNLYAYAGNNPISAIDPEGTVDPVTVTVVLVLIGFGAAAYTAGKSAQRFGENNPLTRTLQAAPAGDPQKNREAHGPNPSDEYFSDPDHGLNQVVTTTGDKVLTTNPVSGPGWSLIKAGNSLSQGNPGEALLNASGALPGDAGAAGTAAGEVYGVCTGP